jgi:P-aminobenzoate N-oxygenase AurF
MTEGLTIERITTSFDTSYAWNYGSVKEGLRDLYEKGKRDQWDGRILPWETDVDLEKGIFPDEINPFAGYPFFEKMTEKEQKEFGIQDISWTLSQFLHGEQGALLVAGQLVDAVPWMDAKLYAASQVMDEARHVEVYDRYLREKLQKEWPINVHLKKMLDIVLKDSRWDFKYLGMQIILEGLAMAAFGQLRELTTCPLLKELIANVMRDESRHVAFGVVSLKGYFDDMSRGELRDREEFIVESCELMRDRLIAEEVYEYMGLPVKEVREVFINSPLMIEFRKLLFSRVVPNIKRLGLLTPHVRNGFERLGILGYEDFPADA